MLAVTNTSFAILSLPFIIGFIFSASCLLFLVILLWNGSYYKSRLFRFWCLAITQNVYVCTMYILIKLICRVRMAVLHVHVIHLVFCNYYCRGTRIKTRKRNIAAPLDPASFSDAIVQIYLDNGGDLVRPSLGVPSASHMLFLLLRYI
jgi:hypothetical protein